MVNLGERVANGQISTQDRVICLVFQSSLKCLPTPRCSVPTYWGCTQPLSSNPKIKLECHGLPYQYESLLRGISTNWSSYSLTQNRSYKSNSTREIQSTQKASNITLERRSQKHNHKNHKNNFGMVLRSCQNQCMALWQSIKELSRSWSAWVLKEVAMGVLLQSQMSPQSLLLPYKIIPKTG